MERVRENYNFQVQNIRDFRQYGSSQVTSVRDQYYEQVSNLNINSPLSQFMELICAPFMFWTLYIFSTLFFRWQESEITQQISCKEFTRITIFKDSVYANSMRKIT